MNDHERYTKMEELIMKIKNLWDEILSEAEAVRDSEELAYRFTKTP